MVIGVIFGPVIAGPTGLIGILLGLMLNEVLSLPRSEARQFHLRLGRGVCHGRLVFADRVAAKNARHRGASCEIS